MKNEVYFWECEKCGRMVQTDDTSKEYIKDHYFMGKFCSNSRFKKVIFRREQVNDYGH